MRPRLLAAALLSAGLVAGCTPPPDTTLDPGAPMFRYEPADHPFTGARLAVDTGSEAARWQRRHDAEWLRPISESPQARWVNGPADLEGAARYARSAHRHGRLAVLVAYNLPQRGCAPGSGGAPSHEDYLRWVDDLARALQETPSVIVLEPDAVAADCFDERRAALLTAAVRRLDAAGQFVYLDAGHSAWRSTGEMAERLLQSGITVAEGFSVNVSNRQSTLDSYRWGLELSDLLGGRQFVIDTSRNGLGAPAGGEWCNARPQALGDPPSTETGHRGLAAYLWIKRPGESDGRCGGETGYAFSPRQARELIVNTGRLPESQRARARQAGDSSTASAASASGRTR